MFFSWFGGKRGTAGSVVRERGSGRRVWYGEESKHGGKNIVGAWGSLIVF